MAGTDQNIVAKYRATTRFRDALKIIEPASERRKQCEYDLASALWGIEHAGKIDLNPSRTLAQYRDLLEKLVGTLREASELAAKAFPPEYQIRRGKDFPRIGEELKRHLKEKEHAFNWTSKRARKGSPRQSFARIEAVDAAYLLLKKYGKRAPRAGYRHGPWPRLASVLAVGNEEADLFDYLKPRLEAIQAALKATAATR